MSETLLALRAALTAAMEKTTDESRLLAAINVLMGQNQSEQQQEKKQTRKRSGHRYDIRGLASLITKYIEQNGPSSSEAIWENLRTKGQIHQNVELKHVERTLNKQTATYVLLPSGKWWLKNRKMEVVA